MLVKPAHVPNKAFACVQVTENASGWTVRFLTRSEGRMFLFRRCDLEVLKHLAEPLCTPNNMSFKALGVDRFYLAEGLFKRRLVTYTKMLPGGGYPAGWAARNKALMEHDVHWTLFGRRIIEALLYFINAKQLPLADWRRP